MPTESAITTRPPLSVAGFPIQSWAFATRIWIASVLALLMSFWFQLEVPSSAMLTVMILAEPTRGQATQKAGYRLVATVLGIVASIAIVGLFAQSPELFLAACAAWLGACIYACVLLDGYRAYAAVLSGYTVGFVAIQQIQSPLHVFEAAMARGAAIAVGVMSITLVNDLLMAPDRHPRLGTQLTAFHRRVRSYAQAVIRRQATDAMAVAALMKEIVALRADITSLAAESASGPARSAAARSAMVALVDELQAIRALEALLANSDPLLLERLAAAFDGDAAKPSRIMASETDFGSDTSLPVPLVWALRELIRRDAEVGLHLAALKSAKRPFQSWRAPFYRSHRIALESGIRAAAWMIIASLVLVLAGWSSASSALSLVAVTMGLGATTPAPRVFTTLGFFGGPIAIALAGVLEFFVLNGVSDFPLLAIGLAPFLIGAGLLASLANPILAGLGKLNLIFISAVLAPSNPQSYDPQSYIFTSLFLCVAISLLLAAQYLIPPVSDGQRRRWLLASAHDELDKVLDRGDRHLAREEVTFRDAVRVGQIASAGPGEAEYRPSVEQALAYFDQAAAIRFCAAQLAQLADGSELASQARAALVARDPQRIRAAADSLGARAPTDGKAAAASAALAVASAVVARAGAAQAHGGQP